MPLRAGIGYDIHKTAKGRKLVLGGVEFKGETGLDGHSDADVLCHAIGDALLGAMSLGDLGTHFPPTEAKWKNAASTDLLRLIRSMIEGSGGKIVNVDATVVCESPKIAPQRDAMTVQIAQALKLGSKQVSIKATTNEGLGPLGKGEGIAAFAIAMVEAGDNPQRAKGTVG
jgi:2-C-methyl-D-erythritol 2,4-cyclodiphosphate synthase